PDTGEVEALVLEAYETYRATDGGEVSNAYPTLARQRADLFGVCVVNTADRVFGVGDAETEFAIMSVSKPFVFARVCAELGPEHARGALGVTGTGLPFNSVTAVERSPDGRTNPMVNSGAIATTSLVPGEGEGERWELVHDALSRFAGRELVLDEEMYATVSA